MDKPEQKSEFELELFSSNYFPRAGAGAFWLQYLLPELELELLGSEIFHTAGAGAYKLWTFLLELKLELRVLDKKKVEPLKLRSKLS